MSSLPAKMFDFQILRQLQIWHDFIDLINVSGINIMIEGPKRDRLSSQKKHDIDSLKIVHILFLSRLSIITCRWRIISWHLKDAFFIHPLTITLFYLQILCIAGGWQRGLRRSGEKKKMKGIGFFLFLQQSFKQQKQDGLWIRFQLALGMWINQV